MKDYLTVSDIAKRLKVSRARVHQLIAEGRIKAERLGPIYAIKPNEFAKYGRKPEGRPSGKK